jgi:hypothetical protein
MLVRPLPPLAASLRTAHEVRQDGAVARAAHVGRGDVRLRPWQPAAEGRRRRHVDRGIVDRARQGGGVIPPPQPQVVRIRLSVLVGTRHPDNDQDSNSNLSAGALGQQGLATM